MAEALAGISQGLFSYGTIKQYNGDGTVTIVLNLVGAAEEQSEIIASLPNAWLTSNGSFAGGYPGENTIVKVVQGHNNKWHCLGYENTRESLSDSSTRFSSALSLNKLRDLKPERFLIKPNSSTSGTNSNRLFVDPEGFSVGTPINSIDLNKNIIRTNFNQNISFTEANRVVSGPIKRDVRPKKGDLSTLGLSSLEYDTYLTTVGMDPTLGINALNSQANARNPPLVETREVVYEFANSYNFSSYSEEFSNYLNSENNKTKILASVSNNRAIPLSLNLEKPNNLMETIKGTVVDASGNILDINRNILAIGKLDELSLKRNKDKDAAFKGIIRELRKSIAYHFEINARKNIDKSEINVPDLEQPIEIFEDFYRRDRSKFSIDIDKEGQFKINVPASSETGNIPLLTRHENYPVLLSKEDDKEKKNPDEFSKAEDSRDIYIENFATHPVINLSGTKDELDGYQSPNDRFDEKPIKLGTAYHDILKTCNEFLITAKYLEGNVKLVNFDKSNRLNDEQVWKPLDYIVSDTIIVSGEDANAGGRSGTINLDGFLSVNVGANTIDRQSLWIDTAGGIVQNIGRDKNGISHAASFDGDVFWQIGGPGIGSEYDPRFTGNDAYRNGTLDIRVLINGQLAIFRIGPEGISIVSPGTITLSCQQDMILKSKSRILLEGEIIMMYAESAKRIVSRDPLQTQIV